MLFYLGTLTGVLGINLACDAILKKKLKDSGYITKTVKVKFSVMSLLNLLLILLPVVNNIASAMYIYITIKCLRDEAMLERCFGGRMYSSKRVKTLYELNTVDEKTLEDMFILDGADEETKSFELKELASQKRGVENVDPSIMRFGLPTPGFTEEEYEWACVEEYAKTLIDVISLDADLSLEDKEKLMKYLRNICKADFEGKEISSDKVMKKILKVAK